MCVSILLLDAPADALLSSAAHPSVRPAAQPRTCATKRCVRRPEKNTSGGCHVKLPSRLHQDPQKRARRQGTLRRLTTTAHPLAFEVAACTHHRRRRGQRRRDTQHRAPAYHFDSAIAGAGASTRRQVSMEYRADSRGTHPRCAAVDPTHVLSSAPARDVGALVRCSTSAASARGNDRPHPPSQRTSAALLQHHGRRTYRRAHAVTAGRDSPGRALCKSACQQVARARGDDGHTVKMGRAP